jgi:hypothetical protein
MKLTSRTTGALLALFAFLAFSAVASGQDRPQAAKTPQVRKDLYGDPLPSGAIAYPPGLKAPVQLPGFLRMSYGP